MKYFFAGVLVPWSAMIPVVVALSGRQWWHRKYWYIFLYLCFSLLANVASRLLAKNGLSNLPLLHADTVVEIFLFSGFFAEASGDSRNKRRIWLTAIGFLLFSVINFVFFQSIYQFNTYTRPAAAIIIMIYCLECWLFPAGERLPDKRWDTVADNWIVSGTLLYFSSALFLFIFSNYLISEVSKEANVFIWNMHALMVFLMYLLFAVAFYKKKNER